MDWTEAPARLRSPFSHFPKQLRGRRRLIVMSLSAEKMWLLRRLYSLVNSIHISNKIIDSSKSFPARQSCHGQWIISRSHDSGEFFKRMFGPLKLIKRLFASLFFIAHWWTLEFFAPLYRRCHCAKGFCYASSGNILRVADEFLKTVWSARNGKWELINFWGIRVWKTLSLPPPPCPTPHSVVIQISFRAFCVQTTQMDWFEICCTSEAYCLAVTFIPRYFNWPSAWISHAESPPHPTASKSSYNENF